MSMRRSRAMRGPAAFGRIKYINETRELKEQLEKAEVGHRRYSNSQNKERERERVFSYMYSRAHGTRIQTQPYSFP